MSRANHFVTQNVPGYGLTDGRFLPSSGVSGRTISFSPCFSLGSYNILSRVRTAGKKCTPRVMISVCNYRKNPGFSRQNKDGFSRNRQNDGRDGSENLKESDDRFSSKNGPVPSVSNPPKYQATSTLGPREMEMVEMFKQIQTELREKTAVQGERKMKTGSTQPRGKPDEHVDYIVEILRKHAQNGKTSRSSGRNRDFIVDEPKSNSPLDLNNNVKGEAQGYVPKSSTFSKPASNFQRRSSVPPVKYQHIRSDSVTYKLTNGKTERIHPDTAIDDPNIDVMLGEKYSDLVKSETQGHEPESPTISIPVSNFQWRSPVPEAKHQLSDSVSNTWISGKSARIHPDTEIDDPRIDGMLEENHSAIDEGYSDDELEEEKPITDEVLRAMKLPELRTLAKSRGLKGFSKLKKSHLLELLSGVST